MIPARPLVISPYHCPHDKNPHCDCDRHITIAAVVGNPSRDEIESSSARIRASWTAEDELDRRATGSPVAYELLRFTVPEKAQALDQDVAEYPTPETRTYRRRKTRLSA